MTSTWLYHATEPARIVTGEAEIQRLLAEGWADSPVKFYAQPVLATQTKTETPRRRERKET